MSRSTPTVSTGRRWRRFTGLLALPCVLAAACGTAPPPPDTPDALELPALKVGLPVATSTFLPLYVAQAEGLFEAEGLDVELLSFRGGTDMIRALVAGSVDVGVVSLAEVTVGIGAGQPLKAFYAGFNVPAFDWYAVPSIASFADARGKRFGVTQYGSSTDFLTRAALVAAGLDPEHDVQIVQGGDSPTRLAAMQAGQLDVNVFAAPEKFIAADRGYSLIFSQRDLAPDYPYHVFAATEAFLAAHPRTVRALLRSHVRGLRLAREDRELATRILVDRLQIDPRYAARTYDDFMPFLFEDGRLPSEAGMALFFRMGVQAGRYVNSWPPERYWTGDLAASFPEWRP